VIDMIQFFIKDVRGDCGGLFRGDAAAGGRDERLVAKLSVMKGRAD